MMTTIHSQALTTHNSASQQVVVVSKHQQLHGLLETVLDAGQYDIVFVESTEHAYTHIKRLAPHLVIVCLDVDDLDGFQVLSMLKLDAETKHIPLVTCTVAHEDESEPDEAFDAHDDMFVRQPGIVTLN
jgi:CheY-like chemotaxis protein